MSSGEERPRFDAALESPEDHLPVPGGRLDFAATLDQFRTGFSRTFWIANTLELENELDRMDFTHRWREEIRAGARYHNRHLDPLNGGFRPRVSPVEPSVGVMRRSELTAVHH